MVKYTWVRLLTSADYIRVYTRDGLGTVGCDPPDYPTAKYIAAHENAYTK